jgi:hypothetical protein
MKKTIILLVIFLLVSSALFLSGIKNVGAQHTSDGQGFPLASPLTIASPSNSTYSSNSPIMLNVTTKILFSPNAVNITYSLDGANTTVLPFDATFVPIEATITYANGTITTGPSMFSPYIIVGSITLPQLPIGIHTLTIYAEYNIANIVAYDSKTVSFSVSDVASLAEGITAPEAGNQTTLVPQNTSSTATSPPIEPASPTQKPTTDPTLSPSPSVPEFPVQTFLPLLLAAAALTVTLWRRFTHKQPKTTLPT